jgi:hypothetical protein
MHEIFIQFIENNGIHITRQHRLAAAQPAANRRGAEQPIPGRTGACLPAHLSAPRQAPAAIQGHGLACIVEVSLDRQGAEQLDAFEARAVADDAVQQCWRVSPGPDFVLVVHTRDMPGYLALSQRLFTGDANVRNVKAFFATRRAKFGTKVPLALDKKAQAAI